MTGPNRAGRGPGDRRIGQRGKALHPADLEHARGVEVHRPILHPSTRQRRVIGESCGDGPHWRASRPAGPVSGTAPRTSYAGRRRFATCVRVRPVRTVRSRRRLRVLRCLRRRGGGFGGVAAGAAVEVAVHHRGERLDRVDPVLLGGVVLAQDRHPVVLVRAGEDAQAVHPPAVGRPRQPAVLHVHLDRGRRAEGAPQRWSASTWLIRFRAYALPLGVSTFVLSVKTSSIFSSSAAVICVRPQ